MRFGRSVYISLSFIVVLFASCVPAHPQDSQSQKNQSVADAARRSRDQKKNSAKPTKVITDEDIEHHSVNAGPDGVNVGAPPSSETQPADSAAPMGNKASDQAAANKAADEDPEILRLKEQVADAAKDLDLARREFALDSDAYYAKPDFANDKAGKAKLDSEQQQIVAKQQQLEALKARLAALQEAQSRRKPVKKSAPGGQTEGQPNPTPANPPQS